MLLNFLPLLILVLAAIVLIILERFNPSMGGAWIVALVSSLLVLITIFIFRENAPPPLVFDQWLMFGDASFNLAFGFDEISWQFIFSVAVILVAVLLTVPIRLTTSNDPKAWIVDLLLTAFAILSTMSQTPITLILTWTMIDIFEIVILVIYSNETAISRQAVISLAARITGTWMLLWVLFFSQFQGELEINFENIPMEYGLLLLLAVILRLGIFPLFVPFSKEIPLRRELGTILRFVVPVSSLTLLSRLSGLVIPSEWAILISIIALLASMFGSVMFLLSSSELTGRYYFLVALVGLATVSVVRGRAEAGLTWSLALILLGSFLSLHSYHKKTYVWLMIIGFLGMTGLPFSPAANGWAGLIVFPFNLLDLLTMIVHTVLLVGFMKHAFRVEQPDSVAEQWMIVLYPLGLGILLTAQWFLGIDTLVMSISSQTWWFSLITTTIALVVSSIVLGISSKPGFQFGSQSTTEGAVERFSQGIVYHAIERIFQMFQALINTINRILEGEGAVLWAFLLFLMVLTLLGIGVGGNS